MNDKNFLGRGIAFPLGVQNAGGLRLSAYETNIEECIRLVLGTAPGERIYRPIFGSRIHDFLFAPNTNHTRHLIAYYAREALLKWEPRISQIEINARADIGHENTILLEIEYVIPATNSRYNLVYPFYLRREEDL